MRLAVQHIAFNQLIAARDHQLAAQHTAFNQQLAAREQEIFVFNAQLTTCGPQVSLDPNSDVPSRWIKERKLEKKTEKNIKLSEKKNSERIVFWLINEWTEKKGRNKKKKKVEWLKKQIKNYWF